MTELPRDKHIPDLISTVEAKNILGISRQAVVQQAAAGQLLGAKIGGTWVFRRVVVERAAMERSHEREADAE